MLDTSANDELLLEESLQRSARPLDRSELRAEALLTLLFLTGCVVLWVVGGPVGAWEPAAAAIGVLVAAVAYRVRFDIGWGYTPSTPLAFTVLWFAAPTQALPPLMLLATLLTVPFDSGSRRLWRRELAHIAGNHLWTFGAAGALVALGPAPELAAPALLVVLAAQLLADPLVTMLRLELRGEPFRVRDELRMSLPVWAIDGSLAITALPVGLIVAEQPLAALAVLPLLGVLAVFARERRNGLERVLELNRAYRGVALVLGDVVEADDGYTGEHSKDVLELALEVGRDLGLPRDRLRDLEFGALLHDIGKITIPKEILHKPGRLTDEEFDVMKGHAAAGQELLDRVGGVLTRVGRVVRHHHERWDGRGYPDGLAGEAIPIESRIIAACDSWNAMRTDRVYRAALPVSAAVFEIERGTGTQFDPHVAAALLRAVQPEVDRAAAAPAAAPLPAGLLELA